MADINVVKKNLVAYSDKMVKDKSLVKRVYNSNAKPISQLRRGLQRDDGKKIAGIAQKIAPGLINQTVNAAIKHVPIVGSAPVISGIITSFSDQIFNEAKNYYRKKQLAAVYSANDDKNISKFEIKNFTIKDIDSYRQKLDVALKHYNEITNQSQLAYKKEVGNGSVCNYHLDICMAAAQLERRLNKMIDAYTQIYAIAEVLRKRILSTTKEFRAGEMSYWRSFNETALLKNDDAHCNCSVCFKDNNNLQVPLDARFASFISNNAIFSEIVKKTFDSSVNEAESKYRDVISGM
ncbi:MAG: hypothetical protein LBE52_15370 [Providencia sp.]|jgi:hypothetical protein|nr:hypothetical protein [Providencia sp.]